MEDGMTPDMGSTETGAAQDGGITTHLGEQGVRETMMGGGSETNNPADVAATQQGEAAGNAPHGTAPDHYEAFTLPEGVDANSEPVKAALDEAGGVFRELGLTQEQGQKLIDLHMKHWMGGAVEAEELFQRQIDQQVRDWEEELKNDAEVGGTRLRENLMYAKRAVAALGGRELAEELDKTGMGSNPVLVRAFVKMGRQYFREDHFVQGDGAKPVDNSPEGMAHRIYPNMRRG